MRTLSRRRFLTNLSGATLIPTLSSPLVLPARAGGDRIGLALGSGGANGLAHIIVLETLEELGLRPARIAGSSIGALVGAFCAAGHDSQDLRDIVAAVAPGNFAGWASALFDRDKATLIDFFGVDLDRGALVDREAFVAFLEDQLGAEHFEALEIPLAVATTDYWERQSVIYERGSLVEAVLASIALPGVFAPVEYQGRFLVDGGLSNPLPYDLLSESTDLTIAVDVVGQQSPARGTKPSYFDLIFHSLQITQTTLIQTKRQLLEPNIYLRPPVKDVRVLDFHRAQEIYEQAQPVKDTLKRALDARLAGGLPAIP